MDDTATPEARTQTRAKSVQEHIDELPMWADGTRLRSAPMTGMQWLIWSLAAAGKFFEGFVVFMTGVALPLLSSEFDIGAAENGLITAATLFGILVGAVGLGGLSDRFGRKIMFLVEMVIFVRVSRGAGASAPTFIWSSSACSESDSRSAATIRRRTSSFPKTSRAPPAASWCSALSPSRRSARSPAPAVGYFVLSTLPDLARLALDVRFGDHSCGARHARPCLHRRERQLAARARRDRRGRAGRARSCWSASRNIRAKSSSRRATDKAAAESSAEQSFASLFNAANRRATILASVPWFLQDLGTYGIGIFTPTILAAAVGRQCRSCAQHRRSDPERHHGGQGRGADHRAADRRHPLRGSARRHRRPNWLQIVGFIGCAAGLFLASLSSNFTGGDADPADLLRLHAVQLHDQPRPERADLSAGRRSVPHGDPRHGRRLRRGLCQDRRGR